jgi:hypothetical protein
MTTEEFINNRSLKNIISILPTTQNLTSVDIVPQPEAISDKSIKVCKLLEIRCIYGTIYEAVGYINSIYGFSVLLELVRNVLSAIVNVIVIMNILRNPLKDFALCGHASYMYASSEAFWIVFLISRQVAITVSCHMATCEAKKIQDNVQCILLRQHVRTEILEQLKHFSTQLTVNRIEFSAFGFFTPNLSTLSTFIVSVITYIIVLEQMN